jgi:hypothetical protein
MMSRLTQVQDAALNQFQEIKPYLPALFFAGGFVFDIFTLGRIDNILNIATHGFFLLLTLALLIMQILEITPPATPGRLVALFFQYRNDAIHFMLGALLNAFVIFYFKSGSLINTFLLVVILFVLLVGNEIEFFKRKGPTLKVALFAFSLSSFFIYLLPVLIGRSNGAIFLGSLLITTMVFLGIWQLLIHLNADPGRIRKKLLIPAGSVIILLAALYAARVIPPIPLSLKQIGIYHNIERTESGFTLYRLTPGWNLWAQGDQDFTAREGDRIYLFSRIFAPGGFRDRLYFHFQLLNGKKKWVTTDRIPLTIVGGRNEGFRGYAYKQNYQAGKWRALVETSEGLEIGRINFRLSLDSGENERTYYRETY